MTITLSPVTQTIVDNLNQISPGSALTDAQYKWYRSDGFMIADKAVEGPTGFDYFYEILTPYDGVSERWLKNLGYWEEISPYDTRISPQASKCGDCGRTLPAVCGGPGGLCLKNRAPEPISRVC